RQEDVSRENQALPGIDFNAEREVDLVAADAAREALVAADNVGERGDLIDDLHADPARIEVGVVLGGRARPLVAEVDVRLEPALERLRGDPDDAEVRPPRPEEV